MRMLIATLFLAITYAQTETKVGFGGGSWTFESPGAMLERIGKLYEPVEDNGGCHSNLIPYDGYCYGTMDYKTEPASQTTKGRDQSGRFMSVPTDCEVAPPDDSVVQNVVMMSPFATTLVVFEDGAGFGTAMSTKSHGFGPGLRYQGSALTSLISERNGQWATAIGHAKVFLRCNSAKAKVDSAGIPRFETPQEQGKPLIVYCGVNKCEEHPNCYVAIQNLEEDQHFSDLKPCPSGYGMMGPSNDESSYCRDPGTVKIHDLTILPDWLVPDQFLRTCMRTAAEATVSQKQGAVNIGPEYAGCFKHDKGETSLVGVLAPRACMKKCTEQGAEYFGLIAESCFCVKPVVGKIAKSDGCSKRSDGVPIGAENSISVYTTAVSQSDLCDELCASGEAGSLCTCDTQPPAKSATTGPEALSILEAHDVAIQIFALIGCIGLIYHAWKCSSGMKLTQTYDEVESHPEI